MPLVKLDDILFFNLRMSERQSDGSLTRERGMQPVVWNKTAVADTKNRERTMAVMLMPYRQTYLVHIDPPVKPVSMRF
jgi:hypothetical protein